MIPLVRATLRANGVSSAQYALALNEWQHFVVVYQADARQLL